MNGVDLCALSVTRSHYKYICFWKTPEFVRDQSQTNGDVKNKELSKLVQDKVLEKYQGPYGL